MNEDEIRLDVESRRAAALLQSAAESYVPLAVAAAAALHHSHDSARTLVVRRDYEEALDMAAAALSRLVTIYTRRGPAQQPVKVDLTKTHFAGGACELRGNPDTIGDLCVARSELASALSLIRRIGLPFRPAGSGSP